MCCGEDTVFGFCPNTFHSLVQLITRASTLLTEAFGWEIKGLVNFPAFS